MPISTFQTPFISTMFPQYGPESGKTDIFMWGGFLGADNASLTLHLGSTGVPFDIVVRFVIESTASYISQQLCKIILIYSHYKIMYYYKILLYCVCLFSAFVTFMQTYNIFHII